MNSTSLSNSQDSVPVRIEATGSPREKDEHHEEDPFFSHLRRPAPRIGSKLMPASVGSGIALVDAQSAPTAMTKNENIHPSIEEEAEKQKENLHFYSREIARMLNPKQHDITGAVVLYNLSLWQGNNYKQTLINGRRYSFRSLTDLQRDHPYFTKAAIHKALKRLEKALGEKFLIKRDKDKLWFSIGAETMEKLKKRKPKKGEVQNTMNGFYVEDAVKSGSVRSAVLFANLKYALSKFTDPKQDAVGNKYAELSPKRLCSILNFSEDTISRALSDMCKKRLIVRFDKASSFYALGDGFVNPKNGRKAVKRRTAEVHSQPAEVHNEPAEVHSRPAEVHSDQFKNALEPLKNKGSRAGDEVTCINECINESGNECIKGSNMTSSAAPRCQPPLNSQGLIKLQKLAEAKLAKMRSSKGSLKSPQFVFGSELPYEHIEDIHDLPYDFVRTDHRSFNAWVKDQVRDMQEYFAFYGQKVDKNDSSKPHRFFSDNPQVDALSLFGLYELLICGPFALISKTEWDKHPEGLLTKTKTPKQFLKYLPQIIVLLNSREDDDPLHELFAIEPPFDNLNYAYLGKVPNSSILPFGPAEVPKEYID